MSWCEIKERLGKGSGPQETSAVFIRSEVVGVTKVANNCDLVKGFVHKAETAE